jgi:protoporphyrinogen oxidase
VRTQIAIIVGAGPAGLTAALELLTRTNIKPIVLEKSQDMGGISRTVNYKGNRMDIGGHRFFSKSDRVMQWWQNILPLQATRDVEHRLGYQGQTRNLVTAQAEGPDPAHDDRVMLIRQRVSRIFFLRKFFAYPISLNADTISKLGLVRIVRVGLSYLKSVAFPIKNERNLEQFFINRFGNELYRTFFKSYTEKVWGLPCNEISAEWGAQRIKGLSIKKAISHFIRQRFARRADIEQKTTETSLIEQFLYPKYGPGQMWEEVAKKVVELGGEVLTGYDVVALEPEGARVRSLTAVNAAGGERRTFEGDYFFSTMPIKELARALDGSVPAAVREVSEGLIYRDFITVGLLLRKLAIKDGENGNAPLVDNWIYIQEPDVSVGRIQIFNNWSPYLVTDSSNVWIGLEYFCYETEPIWQQSDEQMIELAVSELVKMDMIQRADVLDATVIRVPKTYPAYHGSYADFGTLRAYFDQVENLFLIGRNGMHRYNNQDHSMLTAMTAVDNIIAGRVDKSNIWAVNTEDEYHEGK